MAICYCPPTHLGSCATCRAERAAKEMVRKGEIRFDIYLDKLGNRTVVLITPGVKSLT